MHPLDAGRLRHRISGRIFTEQEGMKTVATFSDYRKLMQQQAQEKQKERDEKEEAARQERQETMQKMFDLQEELDKTREEYGVEPKDGFFTRLVKKYYAIKDRRSKVQVKKKTYIWVAVLLGWAGGHRFMCHQYISATLYLLLCWTGFPMAMTIIDILEVVPMKADEDGKIII